MFEQYKKTKKSRIQEKLHKFTHSFCNIILPRKFVESINPYDLRWNRLEKVIKDPSNIPRTDRQLRLLSAKPFPILSHNNRIRYLQFDPVSRGTREPSSGGQFAEHYTTVRRARKAREKTRRKYEGLEWNGTMVGREQKITERTIWEITEALVLVSNRLNLAAGRIPCCPPFSVHLPTARFLFFPWLRCIPAMRRFCIFCSAFCVLPRARSTDKFSVNNTRSG